MSKDDNRIVLDDIYGNSTVFEFLGICEYMQQEYVILIPDNHAPVANAIAMLIVNEGERELFYPINDPIKEQRIISTFRANEQGMPYPGDDREVPIWRTLFPRPMRGYHRYLLYFFRMIVPIISLLLFRPYFAHIYIAPLNKILPPSSVSALLQIVHILSISYSDPRNRWRGWRYTLAVSLLPTEICLFLFFSQHQFSIAVILLIVLMVGAVALICFRRPIAYWLSRQKYLIKDFALDLANSTGNTNYNRDFPKLSLRRYLVITTSILMLIPSILVCCKYGMNSVGHVPSGSPPPDFILSDDEWIFDHFTAEHWASMDDDEKLKSLQVVADIETRQLNIDPVYVLPISLNDDVLGQHPYESRFVIIDLNKESHQDGLTCINTILHECRHVYQSDCVNSLDWTDPSVQTGLYYENARKWRSSFLAYATIDTEKDYSSYYYQSTEMDAREYAQKRMESYELIITAYEQNTIGEIEYE